MTVVHKKTERDTLGSGDKFHTSLTVRGLSQRQIQTVSTNMTCGTRRMTKLNTKQRSIGLREARKKLPHATAPRRFYKRGDNSRERLAPNRSTSIQELKKVTTCNRCGAFGHWEDACPQRDTAGCDHRVIDPADAEGAANNRAQERVTERRMQGQRRRWESQV